MADPENEETIPCEYPECKVPAEYHITGGIGMVMGRGFVCPTHFLTYSHFGYSTIEEYWILQAEKSLRNKK